MDIFTRIREAGIIPVITVNDEEQAVLLAEALRKGNMNCIEVTLRTEKALKAIAVIKEKFSDCTVGAGTVLTIEQANEAIAVGADFIFSQCVSGAISYDTGIFWDIQFSFSVDAEQYAAVE